MDMRIANVYNSYSVTNIKNAPGSKKTGQSGKVGAGKDSFSMSTQAEDYQIARKALVALPDIRSDKVGSIITKINAGEYNVSSRDIAAKILKGLEE